MNPLAQRKNSTWWHVIIQTVLEMAAQSAFTVRSFCSSFLDFFQLSRPKDCALFLETMFSSFPLHWQSFMRFLPGALVFVLRCKVGCPDGDWSWFDPASHFDGIHNSNDFSRREYKGKISGLLVENPGEMEQHRTVVLFVLSWQIFV